MVSEFIIFGVVSTQRFSVLVLFVIYCIIRACCVVMLFCTAIREFVVCTGYLVHIFRGDR